MLVASSITQNSEATLATVPEFKLQEQQQQDQKRYGSKGRGLNAERIHTLKQQLRNAE